MEPPPSRPPPQARRPFLALSGSMRHSPTAWQPTTASSSPDQSREGVGATVHVFFHLRTHLRAGSPSYPPPKFMEYVRLPERHHMSKDVSM